MIEEILMQKDQIETDKMIKAINRQAHFKRLEEENKRMLKNIDKELKKDTKKEFKEKLIDDSINFALFVAFAIPTIMLLVVLCY